MYWQRSYIEHALSLAATSGTKTIDLPKSAQLSELLLRFKATNDGTNPNRNNPLYDKITKIEVMVDGSTVVKSLNAKELQALAFYNTGKIPLREFNDEAAGTQWEFVPIHFGRRPGDLEYGLDCTKHVNPQLKITWDTTGAGTASTDLFSTSTYPVLDLQATQLMEGPGTFPKGYIKGHEIQTWSFASNSEEKRVELPTGNLIRRIGVRCYTGIYWPRQGLDFALLDLNLGVSQPFKMYTPEWEELMRRLYGAVVLKGKITLKDTQVAMELGIADGQAVAGVGRTANMVIHSNGGSGGKKSLAALDTTAVDGTATGILYDIIAVGDQYHSCFAIPLDWPDDSFMLDSKRWQDVDLVLTAASSGISTIAPAMAVFMEEVIAE